VGRVPLPPYIKRSRQPGPDSKEAEQYQTVYAKDPGAVAAPTAGLHFTPELLARLAEKGVEQVKVTLHVGYGTFEPLKPHHLAEGKLHPESFEVSPEAAQALEQAVGQGRRVVAVGTSTVRLLEHLALGSGFNPGPGTTDLFIRPGFEFKVVKAVLTNFHLPGTSLIMLVSALAGREKILGAYAQALKLGYRFYSFGDAMFIDAGRNN
ncbi:MAG: S-adenosylmethionine:tRNA ribosyltransferase-isomerase, partial [Deltaproteobacteria bacterium]|nr:S-adenosylmethionine:tRNA ribosyltransferase-isomerase [Deltaproteobacteria bacterium]